MEYLLAIIVTLLLSAFFSGMEIAFISSNKLRIGLEYKQGSFSAKLLAGFLKRPSRFIGTMLVGNNMVLVLYGIFMGLLLDQLLESFGFGDFSLLAWQTVISTVVILFFGEFIPKALFRINSNSILTLFAIPLKLIYFILWLPMFIMVGLSELILKYVFRVDISKQEIAFGRIDLDNYVREIAEKAENSEEEVDTEIRFMQNALVFSKVKARDCMVPRTEISAVEIEDSVEKLKHMFIQTGYSKVLVYRDNIDNIIGYVNSVELFHRPDSIKRLIVPVIIIPETISAREVLELFIKQNKSIAVVVDEFGGTSGMLTIEDLMEEIFGDIEDEHDDDDFIEEQIDDHTFIFSARLEIDYLNANYKLGIPEEEEYETLAGYILHHHEAIPELNAVLEVENYNITVTDVSSVRIETVKLQVMSKD
jgi:CBS domain containing-hemolysin-like protein